MGKRPITERGWERILEQRKSFGRGSGFRFSLRARMDRLEMNLEKGGSWSPSASSLAASLSSCAVVLNCFSASDNWEAIDRQSKFFGFSPNRIARMAGEVLKRLVVKIRILKAHGVDPQAEVSVKPGLDRIRAAVVKWQQWAKDHPKSAK
jgi:hypothetical protein